MSHMGIPSCYSVFKDIQDSCTEVFPETKDLYKNVYNKYVVKSGPYLFSSSIYSFVEITTFYVTDMSIKQTLVSVC